MEKRIALGRLGKPEDLAGPSVFFLSDMAQYGARLFQTVLEGSCSESDLFLVNWCCSDGGVAIGGRRCLCEFAVMEDVYNERSDLPCNRQSILQEGDHHTCLPHSPGAMGRSELDSHVLQLGRELGIFVQLFQLFSESAQSPLEYARAKGYFHSCVSCTRISTIKATLKSWLFINGEKSDSRRW